MASSTQWTWVSANSRRYSRSRKPGVLQSMGWQRVGRSLVTEQQQQIWNKDLFLIWSFQSSFSLIVVRSQNFLKKNIKEMNFDFNKEICNSRKRIIVFQILSECNRKYNIILDIKINFHMHNFKGCIYFKYIMCKKKESVIQWTF